jgi:putative ATP-binding cassette transporter
MPAQAKPANEARLTRETWRQFTGALKSVLASPEVGRKAIAMLGGLVALMLAISGLNVLNSYVARDFMTAIENKQHGAFVREAALYIGVFAASTVVAVMARFLEERLGLLWRAWLTERLVGLYLAGRTYQRLHRAGGLTNPDQRITEDVRTFVQMTLSLLLMFLNGTVTVVAFSGVLWSISRPLFLVGIAYAAIGSLLTVLLGRPLIRLNYRQADREANFRADLIHVRENAESVALSRREPQLEARLVGRIDALVANAKRIIAVNRNVGYFTTGYNYMIQIIPLLLVAPLFMRGEAQFGVITQAAMAFSNLLGAFSLIVTQFLVISSYAAVLARLSALAEGMRNAAKPRETGIEVVEADTGLAYERLTLRTAHDGQVLVRELSATVPLKGRLLIRSHDGAPPAALLRATGGLWENGEGKIVRPPLDAVAFLPERPYLPPGTLRAILTGRATPLAGSEAEVRRVLQSLDLDDAVERAGGLDVERDWEDALSLREQELLSIGSVLLTAPRVVFFERIGNTLEPDQITTVLGCLARQGIAYVTIGNGDQWLEHYDAVLDLAADGRWTWSPIRDGKLAAGE